MNSTIATLLGTVGQVVPILLILFITIKNRKDVFAVQEHESR
jgi:hypothetical protein